MRTIPADAKVLEGDSLYVYAGFIDGLSHTGVPKPKPATRSSASQKPNDTGNPTHERAGIEPGRELLEVLKTDDKSIADMRKLGFTMSHSVPYGKMLPGKGAIIVLHGEDVEPNKMIYRPDVATFAQLQSASGVYPGTVIGVMSKFRELYKQAVQFLDHEVAYEKDPSDMKRPTPSPAHKALYPVINGRQPIFFLADDVKSFYRVMTLQQDLGFPLVLGGLKQGWHVADKIKANKVPVFLTMDLPKDKGKKEKKESKDEKEEGDKEEKPAEEMTEKGGMKDAEKEKLEVRQELELKKHYSQGATFQENGITFGFASMDAKASEIRKNLQTMIENGLSEKTALAALTTNPAKILGLDAVAGTIAKGKMGNLVVTDKPYFEEKSNVRYVVVEGEVFEYEVKKKKKGDPNAKVNPAGTWTYAFDAGGQAMSGTIVIKSNDGTLSGTISNPMTGQKGDIEDMSLDGNALTFTIPFNAQGQSITVEYDLTIIDDSMEGTVTAGSFGSFPVEYEREKEPE